MPLPIRNPGYGPGMPSHVSGCDLLVAYQTYLLSLTLYPRPSTNGLFISKA